MRGGQGRRHGVWRSIGLSAATLASLSLLTGFVTSAQGQMQGQGQAQGQGPEISGLVPFLIEGDAILAPLAAPGDAGRGRAIVTDRRKGLCLLCHSGPFAEERFQGNLAPTLAGAGQRWSEGQLRLRIVDSARVVPNSLMPGYHRLDGLARVGQNWQGKPILSAQEVEDVVAFLVTLRE